MIRVRVIHSQDGPAQSQRLSLQSEAVGGAIVIRIEDVIDPLWGHGLHCVDVGGQVTGV